MAKKKSNYIPVLITIAIVIAAVYFVPKFLNKTECKVDSDCGTDKVCTMDGKCVTPEIVDERKRDNLCPDNTYPTGAYDPDCPMYCPASFERKGGVTMCCMDKDMQLTIDCDTEIPINLFTDVTFGIPSQKPAQEWYDKLKNRQAMISFVPKGATKVYNYKNLPMSMSIAVTTGSPISGSTGYLVWLSSITVKSKTTSSAEPIMTNLWSSCKTVSGKSCIGKDGGATVSGTLPSAWAIIGIQPDSISIDEYLASFSYCGIAVPETLGVPQQCPSAMEYDLSVAKSDFSFSINVGLG